MKKWLLFLLLLIFTGCTYKTTPIAFTFKAPNIKINDQGFLKTNFYSKVIEVYMVGKLAFVFKVYNSKICVDNKCYDKKLFVKNLNKEYPITLFDDLINKKPLPNIKIVEEKSGFTQKNDKIIYQVAPKKVFFIDKNKKIVFFIKNL
jgi:hypothetical protein